MKVNTLLYNVQEMLRINYIVLSRMKVHVGFRVHTNANIFKCFSFFLVFLGFLCGKVCVCVGDALSCFRVCIFWKCRPWLVEPGNLGICKVSTITKAINLDTIMQSREEEDRKKPGKAMRKRTRGKRERKGCSRNADEMMADHHSEAVNSGARDPSTSVVFMMNESSLSVVSESPDRQIAG